MYANTGLVKTYTAGGAIAEYRIVKHGATDREALQATAVTEKFAGVVGLPKGASAVSGDSVDVIKSGVADVLYGGTVAVGDPLTTDNTGRAVVATDGDALIGDAQVAGAVGDIGAVLIRFGTHYVPA